MLTLGVWFMYSTHTPLHVYVSLCSVCVKVHCYFLFFSFTGTLYVMLCFHIFKPNINQINRSCWIFILSDYKQPRASLHLSPKKVPFVTPRALEWESDVGAFRRVRERSTCSGSGTGFRQEVITNMAWRGCVMKWAKTEFIRSSNATSRSSRWANIKALGSQGPFKRE